VNISKNKTEHALPKIAANVRVAMATVCTFTCVIRLFFDFELCALFSLSSIARTSSASSSAFISPPPSLSPPPIRRISSSFLPEVVVSIVFVPFAAHTNIPSKLAYAPLTHAVIKIPNPYTSFSVFAKDNANLNMPAKIQHPLANFARCPLSLRLVVSPSFSFSSRLELRLRNQSLINANTGFIAYVANVKA
jgi:hypothetical protein